MAQHQDKSAGNLGFDRRLQMRFRRFVRGLVKDEAIFRSHQSRPEGTVARIDESERSFALVITAPERLGTPLSPRERHVAMLIGRGYGNQGIAFRLGIATSTVLRIVQSIFAKWGVRSRAAIARRAALLYAPEEPSGILPPSSTR